MGAISSDQFLGDSSNIARPEHRNHVTIANDLRKHLPDGLEIVDEDRVHQATHSYRATQGTAVGSRNGRLSGCINFKKNQNVRSRQHIDEIFEKIPRSRISVRLIYDDETPFRPASPDRFKHSVDLFRMMAIIVDDSQFVISDRYG